MDSKQKNGKIPANKISERKNPHTHAQPHQGAHVPPARAACACSNQAELRTEKWTASKRTGKSPQTKSQNAKISQYAHNPTKAHTCPRHVLRALAPTKPNSERENGQQAELRTKILRKPNLERKKRIHARQFHPGAHVPPARATCACSEKAELRTGKSPQTKSQNAKIPTHTRNPTKAHTCPQHVLRALAPTKPNLERGKWTASKISERKNPTHARNPTKAHTCFARAACACSEKANLRTGKMDSKRRFL